MNRCCRVALCQPWKRAPWTLGGGARPDAAPQPLPAAVCPHAEGAQTGVTGRLCARRRVSGASPSDPACSFQGLRPSARPPGARRRGHVTVCLLGPASSCPCLAGGKRWAWRSGACVATRPPWSWCCPLATGRSSRCGGHRAPRALERDASLGLSQAAATSLFYF